MIFGLFEEITPFTKSKSSTRRNIVTVPVRFQNWKVSFPYLLKKKTKMSDDSRRRLAMLASIGTLMIKKVVRNKKRTTFLMWKEKTEVARERERFMEVRAVCEGVRKGKDEELKDVESDLRKVRYNLDLEKKERLDLEQLFAKYQHELVALKQKETELKSAIRENLRTK